MATSGLNNKDDPHSPLDTVKYIIDYTSPRILVNHVMGCTFTVVVTILIICLNSVTILAYWKSSQLRKKTTNFLIFILSINDLAVGIIVGPLFITLFIREIALKRATDIINYLNLCSIVFLSTISFQTMIIMNCERYLGIVHPIFHRMKVTKKRLLRCLIFIWIFGAAQNVLLFHYEAVIIKLITIEVILLLVLLLYMYVKIYLSAPKSRNKVHQDEMQRFKEKTFMKNAKLAKSCFLVIISSYICFIPASIVNGMTRNRSEGVYLMQIWCEVLLLLNSCLNSVLFFWSNNCLRKEAFILLGCNLT